MNKELKNTVDTRVLKSGQIRLRFKVSERSYNTVIKTLSLTGYTYDNSSLDAISINYLAGNPAKHSLDFPADGVKRFLIKLYPDEYEIVREALDVARQFVNSDAEALTLICLFFYSCQENHKEC